MTIWPHKAETSHNSTQSFVEIFLNDQNSACPDFIDVYVCEIKSSLCRTFVDELSVFLSSSVLEDEMIKDTSESFGFPSLAHLRRVRRRTLAIHGCNQAQTTSDDTFISSTDRLASLKSNKSTVVKLEVLLTSVKYLDYVLSESDQTREKWNHIVSKYNLSVVKRVVPGRSAKSQEEMNEWKSHQNDLEDDAFDGPTEYKRTSWWPTLFFPEKTDEYMLRKLELTFEDIDYMRDGMMEAISDSKQHKAMSSHYIPGAVVMSPSSKIVIASSFQERKLQTQTLRSLDHGIDMDLLQVNPLCTPILLAIQGVSRRERCTIAEANVNTDDPTGQYICTGYDLFTTKEPSIFEAMALVHSRIRRVIFGSSNKLDGGLGGTGLDHAIHSLPGTNHHYRAFQCNPMLEDDLHTLCEDLQTC